MADQPVVIAVAAYASKAAAEQDFHRICTSDAGRDLLTAALVEKGADGRLVVDRYHSTGSAECLVGGLALLGGALLVLAAPLGVAFLAAIVSTTTTWAGVGAIVSHLWNDIPKGVLHHMSDLVETRQATLVVVAVDRLGDDVRPLLVSATATVVTDLTPTDIEADFSKAIEEAETTGG